MFIFRVAIVWWLERLGIGAESHRKVGSSRLGFAIRRLENSLYQSSSKEVHFSNQRRIRQRKKGWVPSFISCAQDTVGLQSLLPLPPVRLLGYGKLLPYLFILLMSVSLISLKDHRIYVIWKIRGNAVIRNLYNQIPHQALKTKAKKADKEILVKF